MTKKVTKRQGEQALAIVAHWLGKNGYGTWVACGKCADCKDEAAYPTSLGKHACVNPILGPAPTGHEAAYAGEGPELNMAWDWPSGGATPTIILEGGPYDWATTVSLNTEMVAKFKAAGIYAEPYSSWALCLYREDA